MTAGLTEDPLRPKFESVTHTISYDHEVMGGTQTGDPASLAKYAGVTIPVLVLDGGESPRYQRNAAGALTEVLPDAEHCPANTTSSPQGFGAGHQGVSQLRGLIT